MGNKFMDEASALHLLGRARDQLKAARPFVRNAANVSAAAQSLDDDMVSLDNVLKMYLAGQKPEILAMISEALYGPSIDWRVYHQQHLAARERAGSQALDILTRLLDHRNTAQTVYNITEEARTLLRNLEQVSCKDIS